MGLAGGRRSDWPGRDFWHSGFFWRRLQPRWLWHHVDWRRWIRPVERWYRRSDWRRVRGLGRVACGTPMTHDKNGSYDGFVTLEAGVDSGRPPNLIDSNQGQTSAMSLIVEPWRRNFRQDLCR